jgi:hypothetical protein
MIEEEEQKSTWKAVNGLNVLLWKDIRSKELHSFDRARTWDIVDKVEEGTKLIMK